MRQLRPQVAYLLDYKRFDKIQAHYAFLVEKSQREEALIVVRGRESLLHGKGEQVGNKSYQRLTRNANCRELYRFNLH